MATQLGAVTGRRVPSRYRSILFAEASRLPAMYELKEARKYRESLAAQRARKLTIAEESQKIQERQAKIATGISAAQVAATGFLARRMLVGGGTTPTGTVPVGSSPDFFGVPGTPAVTPWYSYLAPAGAGYLSGGFGYKMGEKVIPKALVRGGRSRSRWGAMAAGAAAGAAAGSFFPGIGTALGAGIGGAAAYVSSLWD